MWRMKMLLSTICTYLYVVASGVGVQVEYARIESLGPDSFTGGEPTDVTIRYWSLRGDGDVIVECNQYPAGWTVSPERINPTIYTGNVYTATFTVTPSASGGSGLNVWYIYDDGIGIHPVGSTILDTNLQYVSASAGSVDGEPTSTRNTPSSSSVTLDHGSEQTFKADGYDSGGDLAYADWSLSGPENATYHDGFIDTTSKQSSYSYTFDVAGDYTMSCRFYDDDGDSAECSWAVHVNSAPMPDLIISDMWTEPETIVEGDSYIIKAKAYNRGNAKAEAGAFDYIEMSFWLGGTYLGGERLQDLCQSIAAGGEYEFTSVSLVAPMLESMITNALRGKVDCNESFASDVDESSESNNDYYYMMTVVSAPKPDLTISSLTASPSAGYTGDSISINSVTKNIGDVDTGWNTWCKVRYYLGRTTGELWREIGAGDTPNFGEVNGISVNEEEADAMSWTVAADLAPGIYYITAVADADDEIDESSEYDSRSVSFVVQAHVPEPPTSPSPSNGSTNMPLSGTLSWTAASYATNYDVYLGTNSSVYSLVHQSTVSSEEFYYSGLSNDVEYFWMVSARNVYGSTNGPVWSFRTEAAQTGPQVDMTIHRVSTADGVADTADPGTVSDYYYPGDTVRITVLAQNYGDSFDAVCVLNIRGPDNSTWVYDSHDPARTPTGTVEDNANNNPMVTGETIYYSFDWVVPSDASAGFYDVAATIRDQSNSDTVVAGLDEDNMYEDWFRTTLGAPTSVEMTLETDSCPDGYAESLYNSDSITRLAPDFSWFQPTHGIAAQYHWKVLQPGESPQDMTDDQSVCFGYTSSRTTGLIESLEDGAYALHARAQSLSGDWSQWSEEHAFFIDRSSPEVVSLVGPENDSVFGSSVTVEWNAASDAGSGVCVYKLIYETDSLFDEERVFVDGLSCVFGSGLDDGTWFWKVHAVDMAGNVSEVSEQRRFLKGQCMSRVEIDSFKSDFGFIAPVDAMKETWDLHFVDSGSLGFNVSVDYETACAATMDVVAIAYDKNGEVRSQYLVKDRSVSGTGSLDFRMEYGGLNQVPYSRDTFELLVKAQIFDPGSLGWPSYTDYSVVTVNQNLPTGYHPSVPSIAWAKKLLTGLKNGTLVLDMGERCHLYELYNQIMHEKLQNYELDSRLRAKRIYDTLTMHLRDEACTSLIELIPHLKMPAWFSALAAIQPILEVGFVVHEESQQAVELKIYNQLCDELVRSIDSGVVYASDGQHSNRVIVDWSPFILPTDSVTHYDVYRSAVDDRATAVLLASVDDGLTDYEDLAVVSGQVYYYWVMACSDTESVWADYRDDGYANVSVNPTPTPSPTPSSSPTPRPTATLLPTATPTPFPTPQPTGTPANRPETPRVDSPRTGSYVSSLTPTCIWSLFEDGGDYETQVGFELQIINYSNSHVIFSNYVACVSGNVYQMKTGVLDWDRQYNLQIRYKDSGGQWSEYSDAYHMFYTPVNMGVYSLNVSNGIGAGSYSNGALVAIETNIVSTRGQEFVRWIAEPSEYTNNLSDPFAASTSFLMPATNVTLTAVYTSLYEVVYVDASQKDDSGDGMSWTTAKRTIQAAVDVAEAGDLVLVTNGVYREGGRVTPQGLLTNRVCVTNSIRIESVNGAEVTVIEGTAGSNGGNDSDSIRCVFMTNCVTIKGFTLKGGHTANSGHAIYDRCGAGLWMGSGSVAENCIVERNVAYDAGGGVLRGSLYSCVIRDNTAHGDGGGAHVRYGSRIYNCAILNNHSDNSGGGVYVTYGEADLRNCTIVGNVAQNHSGGVSAGRIYNCIVWGNSAVADGNDIRSDGAYPPDVQYSCASDGLTNGVDGCTTNDPMFIEVASSNYWMNVGSPCRDHGCNAYAPTNVSPYDLAGNPRIWNGTVEMGAYESYKKALTNFVLLDDWLVYYGLSGSANAEQQDVDGDGMTAWEEYVGGTDPTDPSSLTAVKLVVEGGSHHSIEWIGGSGVVQYLEWTTNIFDGDSWVSVLTNQSISTTNQTSIDSALPNGYYRIRAVRPEE